MDTWLIKANNQTALNKLTFSPHLSLSSQYSLCLSHLYLFSLSSQLHFSLSSQRQRYGKTTKRHDKFVTAAVAAWSSAFLLSLGWQWKFWGWRQKCYRSGLENSSWVQLWLWWLVSTGASRRQRIWFEGGCLLWVLFWFGFILELGLKWLWVVDFSVFCKCQCMVKVRCLILGLIKIMELVLIVSWFSFEHKLNDIWQGCMD